MILGSRETNTQFLVNNAPGIINNILMRINLFLFIIELHAMVYRTSVIPRKLCVLVKYLRSLGTQGMPKSKCNPLPLY